MAKTITEQINDLQKENNRLKELDKLFDKAVKNEFNMDKKIIHNLLDNWEGPNEYFAKICDYFELESTAEMREFVSIICCEHVKNYLTAKRTNE